MTCMVFFFISTLSCVVTRIFLARYQSFTSLKGTEMKGMNWMGGVAKKWQRQVTASRRSRTASLLAVAAEVFEERIVLSATAVLPPPNPADFGINTNDPAAFMNNPGYAPFMAAQLAYANQYMASAVVTTSGGSVLDNYANAFNSTLGSGWSNLVGGAIYTVLPVSDATLANTSDAALITGTTIVSIPLGIGILAGGEALLGVGTFGGGGSTAAAGGAAAGVGAETATATTATEVITGTIEVTITDSGEIIVGQFVSDAEAAALADTGIFSLAETWPVIPPLP